jgi:CRISPR-associated protein Cmr3
MKKNVSDDEEYERKKYLSYKTYKLSQSNDNASNLISSSSAMTLLKFQTNEEIEVLENGFIDSFMLKKYTKGRTEAHFEGRAITDFLTNEPKVGIGRNNDTHVTEEGLLYRVGMQRTKDIELFVEFEEVVGLSFNKDGFLKLGAESKSTGYKESKETINLSFQSTGLEDNETNFKIYLATPAFFEKGWFPTKIFEENDIEVELITAAVGKPINIGGFDIVKRKPKPMMKAVPAGSVYYYKLKKGSLSRLATSIEVNSISETRKREGFGIAYLSKI